MEACEGEPEKNQKMMEVSVGEAVDLKDKDKVNNALQRLAKSSSKLQSSVFVKVDGVPSIGEVSSPTVSCASFSDDDFSLCSAEELLLQAKRRLNQHNIIENIEDDDLLSCFSMNTRSEQRISNLRKKLDVSENTKLQLLTQCASLNAVLEKIECNQAKVSVYKEYKKENAKLREEAANTTRDFMNEVNHLAIQQKEMRNEYERKLKEKDAKIARLEVEVQKLKKAPVIEQV
jgi:hypothetical protein